MVIRAKGASESLWHICSLLAGTAISYVSISLLRMRGYDVDFSASVSSGSIFFQSTKHAIRVGKKSRIGRGTRISAGFDGTLTIGEHVLIDDYSMIMAQQRIEIGNNTQISAGCFITDFNHRFRRKGVPIHRQGYQRSPVVIGNDVWIGTHSVILAGVTIGDGAVIGAGSVVTHDVARHQVVAGNPAKFIRMRK